MNANSEGAWVRFPSVTVTNIECLILTVEQHPDKVLDNLSWEELVLKHPLLCDHDKALDLQSALLRLSPWSKGLRWYDADDCNTQPGNVVHLHTMHVLHL